MINKIKIKYNKKSALTLTEVMIVMIIIPLVVVASMMALRPKDIKKDAMLKASKMFYADLVVVTNDVARRYSNNANLSGLYTKDKTSRFEITDSDATDKLLELYAVSLRRSRENSTMTYEDYSGHYKVKNGAYFALKTYGDCTTTTTTYNPMYEEAMYEYDTCGAIVYDINDEEEPNELGVDRYIIGFDKNGLR